MTDDTDNIIDKAWNKRRPLKYRRRGGCALPRRTNGPTEEPRAARLVLTSQHIAHDMELFFLLNADYFKQKR